ncbi:MAG TPA: type III-B CRISPR module-associated protein Cmr5 [Ktedonobacteraceae bacterium]|jgi:CRISPR-associated protein Cmr5|nr:type III-B CRISPR module-associated protein Cmr5 [Ktedonobacteraceae bacterium]
MKTRDQEYASDAVQKVLDVKKNLNDVVERNRYGSMAHQLPILIRTAGLAQALAFLETRESKGHRQLLEDLAATVGLPGTLPREARTLPLNEYMHLTRQVMAALLWYKRFAQSILDIKSNVGRDVNVVSVPQTQTSNTEANKG